jgi:hypothetical protein
MSSNSQCELQFLPIESWGTVFENDGAKEDGDPMNLLVEPATSLT